MPHAKNPRLALLLITFASLCLPVASRAQTANPPLTIPGAVLQPPAWLTATKIPFDLNIYFALPKPEENAAPLYLDVFCDLDESAASSILRGRPDRESRMAAARARQKAFDPVYVRFDQNPFSVPIPEIDQALEPYEPLLSRLIQAQARPRCVFATGLSLDSNLSHAQAARVPARLFDMRAHASLFRGHFGDAIRDIQAALRLARDLRPRGGIVVQLVSLSIEGLILNHTIPRFLHHPNLATQHIDDIIATLIQHQSGGLHPIHTASQAEYLILRNILHDLVALSAQPPARSAESRRLIAMTLLDDFGEGPQLQSMIDKLARFSPQDESRIVSQLDRIQSTVELSVALAPHLLASKLESLKIKPSTDQLSSLILNLSGTALARFTESVDRVTAERSSTLAILALRRYELEQQKPAPDLPTALKAAKIQSPLLDPFDGKPIRAVRQGTDWLVYSIGKDRIDQKGQVDADRGRNPTGDLLFRIPRPPR